MAPGKGLETTRGLPRVRERGTTIDEVMDVKK
jgi:hypothetical protein